MIKIFYDGKGCIFTANDLRLLDSHQSRHGLRHFLKENTTKQSGNFLLPENVENRFNVIGDAVVEYLCFDDDSDKRMYLIWGSCGESFSHIKIFNKAELKTFRADDSENALTLLIDDGNIKAEPKKESTLKTENLLKLVRCMAIDKYDYDPKASRNDATGENNNSISNRVLTKSGFAPSVRHERVASRAFCGEATEPPIAKGHIFAGAGGLFPRKPCHKLSLMINVSLSNHLILSSFERLNPHGSNVFYFKKKT